MSRKDVSSPQCSIQSVSSNHESASPEDSGGQRYEIVLSRLPDFPSGGLHFVLLRNSLEHTSLPSDAQTGWQLEGSWEHWDLALGASCCPDTDPGVICKQDFFLSRGKWSLSLSSMAVH